MRRGSPGRSSTSCSRHGTTTAVAYCSVHPASVDAYFAAAEARNLRMIGGKVMMDRNCPGGRPRHARSRPTTTRKALIDRWHGRGRALYAISPRFAITSTPEQMEMAQALVAEHPDLHMQTHLSENRDEIDFTLSLYPKARDYLDVYETYGLLGPKSLFGHAIHLSDRETAAMAATARSRSSARPRTSSSASGLYDKVGLREKGVRRAIATDVGGGTNYSMLRTLDEGYKVLALRGQKLDPLKAFWWITRGNAEALGLADRIGTLAPGSEADIVVLDSAATPAMALRRGDGRDARRGAVPARDARRRPRGRRRPMSPASAGRPRRSGVAGAVHKTGDISRWNPIWVPYGFHMAARAGWGWAELIWDSRFRLDLIYPSGWGKEASMDGATVFDRSSRACG